MITISGPKRVDQASEPNAQEMSRSLHFLERDKVSGGNRLGKVAALQSPASAGHLVGQDRGQAFANRLLHAPGDGRFAGERFHASPGPAAAARAAGLDDHVSDLARISG